MSPATRRPARPVPARAPASPLRETGLRAAVVAGAWWWVLATAGLTLPAVALPAVARAQEGRPSVLTEQRSMSEGSQTAFVTTVTGGSEKLAAAEWKALMREYGGKAKRGKPEALRTEAVVIRSIGGSEPVDTYVDFDDRGDDVLVRLWVRHRGDFVGEASAERDVAATEDLLREYHLRVRRAVVQRELDGEERELARLERRLTQIERDVARAERDIERARDAIERAEAAIVRAEGQIADGQVATEETQAAMAAQAEAVEAVREKLAGVGRSGT